MHAQYVLCPHWSLCRSHLFAWWCQCNEGEGHFTEVTSQSNIPHSWQAHCSCNKFKSTYCTSLTSAFFILNSVTRSRSRKQQMKGEGERKQEEGRGGQEGGSRATTVQSRVWRRWAEWTLTLRDWRWALRIRMNREGKWVSLLGV